MTESDFDKKWNSKYMEKVSTEHLSPSPETRERLAKLETNHCNIMDYLKENKEEHKELFTIVKDINIKLDNALKEKADKSEVADLSNKVKELDTWKIKVIAIGSVVVFIVTFFKDLIINWIKA